MFKKVHFFKVLFVILFPLIFAPFFSLTSFAADRPGVISPDDNLVSIASVGFDFYSAGTVYVEVPYQQGVLRVTCEPYLNWPDMPHAFPADFYIGFLATPFVDHRRTSLCLFFENNDSLYYPPGSNILVQIDYMVDGVSKYHTGRQLNGSFNKYGLYTCEALYFSDMNEDTVSPYYYLPENSYLYWDLPDLNRFTVSRQAIFVDKDINFTSKFFIDTDQDGIYYNFHQNDPLMFYSVKDNGPYFYVSHKHFIDSDVIYFYDIDKNPFCYSFIPTSLQNVNVYPTFSPDEPDQSCVYYNYHHFPVGYNSVPPALLTHLDYMDQFGFQRYDELLTFYDQPTFDALQRIKGEFNELLENPINLNGYEDALSSIAAGGITSLLGGGDLLYHFGRGLTDTALDFGDALAIKILHFFDRSQSSGHDVTVRGAYFTSTPIRPTGDNLTDLFYCPYIFTGQDAVSWDGSPVDFDFHRPGSYFGSFQYIFYMDDSVSGVDVDNVSFPVRTSGYIPFGMYNPYGNLNPIRVVNPGDDPTDPDYPDDPDHPVSPDPDNPPSPPSPDLPDHPDPDPDDPDFDWGSILDWLKNLLRWIWSFIWGFLSKFVELIKMFLSLLPVSESSINFLTGCIIASFLIFLIKLFISLL